MAEGADQVARLVVTGEGVALARPDSCVVGVALNAMHNTVGEALRAVTTIADAAITALREIGFTDVDLPTRNLSVRDWFDPQTQEVTSRVATYQLAIVVRDLPAVSTVVDALAAIAGDALQIQGITFAHSDPVPLRAQARRDAVEDARARAEQLAAAAGLELGPIEAITEGAAADASSFRAVARSAAPEMPINPGNQAVTARVTVTYALCEPS